MEDSFSRLREELFPKQNTKEECSQPVEEEIEDSGVFSNWMADNIFGADEDDEEDKEEQYIGRYSNDKTALIECPKDFSGTYVIPDGVEEILTCAFQDCAGLNSVIMSDSVTEIGESAFEDCESVVSLNIPDGVTAIEKSTFSGCAELRRIDIPDSVTEIGESAFAYCESLESIRIPNGVTAI